MFFEKSRQNPESGQKHGRKTPDKYIPDKKNPTKFGNLSSVSWVLSSLKSKSDPQIKHDYLVANINMNLLTSLLTLESHFYHG